VPSQEITADNFRLAMSAWPTGVSVITSRSADVERKPIGIVCNSLTSISLHEKLILWSVDKSSSSYASWVSAESFQIHFLAEDQQDLVARFAKKGVDKFEGLTYTESALGNPTLEGVNIQIECRRFEIFDTPDHSLIIGNVVNLINHNKPPLLYLHSSLKHSLAVKTN